MNLEQAQRLLQQALGHPNAQFREGQWEAIDRLVNQKQKLLVVQRTGWGKSAVYFISAKIFRARGLGPTLIISPLLALMRNQIEAAQRLGICALTMNSSNTQDWQSIRRQVLANQIDCLLISPERLANDDFISTVLQPIADRIALMVIDEAHCISDWGHDFRPDYRRIVNILKYLPANTPVLGTTATANNRVIDDIQNQLGQIQIQRGVLSRESLALYTAILPDQATRLAALGQLIPTLKGTGIVYVLTRLDAIHVSKWLNDLGIQAESYFSGITHDDFIDPKTGKPDSDAYRQHLENQLIKNQIKVLVATTALGMGYDKPDLHFVIHYQAPGSVIAYYQQVGRAGRSLKHALGLLFAGTEDESIHAFFRNTAFPPETQVNTILDLLTTYDGCSTRDLETHSNLRPSQIEKVLKLLSVENPAPVVKIANKWHRTPIPYVLDHARIAHLTQQREQEWAELQRYIHTADCKMSFLRHALDEIPETITPCGRCVICRGRGQSITLTPRSDLIHQAQLFLRHAEFPIMPKIQVASHAFIEYGFRGNLPVGLRAQTGKVLSRWGDGGWGQQVAKEKQAGYLSDTLVDAMYTMITERWQPHPMPTWICYVPSHRHPTLVADFAQRLAQRLALPLVHAIVKIKDNAPQKGQHNRFHQCRNLDGVFQVQAVKHKQPVLLIDDVIDSGWTLTVLAALLQQAGSGLVYPAALASSSVNDS